MEYPVLPKDIQEINRQLSDLFGIDTESTKPIWRVSWSNDQYEHRLTEFTDAGVLLLTPEIRILPKYQWIRSRWILEKLSLVPDFQQQELAGKKVSYECIHAFKEGQEPKIYPCVFLVHLIHAAMGKSPIPRYVDPESEEPLEAQAKRIDTLVEELFGDESSLLGRTITGEAIIVP